MVHFSVKDLVTCHFCLPCGGGINNTLTSILVFVLLSIYLYNRVRSIFFLWRNIWNSYFTQIAYDLTVCHDLEPMSFQKIQGHWKVKCVINVLSISFFFKNIESLFFNKDSVWPADVSWILNVLLGGSRFKKIHNAWLGFIFFNVKWLEAKFWHKSILWPASMTKS